MQMLSMIVAVLVLFALTGVLVPAMRKPRSRQRLGAKTEEMINLIDDAGG